MQDGTPGKATERGFPAALGSRDDPGVLVHVATTLHRLHHEGHTVAAMDPWLDALDEVLSPYGMAPPPELEAFVFQAALPVLARRPAHAALPLWHARALSHLRAPSTADNALHAATFAFEYTLRSGNFRAAREIVHHARRHIPAASTQVRVSWLEAEALEAWLSGEHERAYAAVEEALAHGGGYGAWEQGASAAISCGDLHRADQCLAAMAAYGPVRAQDAAHAAFLTAARARIGGDLAQANAHIDTCLAVDEALVPAYFMTLWLLGRVYLDIASRKYRRAARDILVVTSRSNSLYWGFLHFSALLARAWLKLCMDRAGEAAADLSEALALAEMHDYRNCDPWWDPEAMRELAALAHMHRVPQQQAMQTLTRRARHG